MCRSGERCTIRAHAFLRLPPPRWAFSSPGPCPHQGSFPKKSGCHDHIPWLRTTCRSAAASPRTIPRNAWAHLNQTAGAGHAIIWGGTLGVRRDVQGARDGELSVPQWRWRVCAIDHPVTNEPTATASAWCSTCLESPKQYREMPGLTLTKPQATRSIVTRRLHSVLRASGRRGAPMRGYADSRWSDCRRQSVRDAPRRAVFSRAS